MSEEQKGWFKTGDEGHEEAQRFQEERAKAFGPMRVWLKPGTGAKLTFLDSTGFFFYEHQLKLNGDWRNWFTCLADFSECPLCEAGHAKTYVAAYTVIDHSKWTSEKTGKVHQNEKKLLVVKSSAMTKLRRRKEQQNGDLTLCCFQFNRDSKDEASTGEDIEFLKKMKRAELLKFKPADWKGTDDEWLAPLNYMELFAPKSVEDLRRVAGQKPPVGSESRDGSPDLGDGQPPVREQDGSGQSIDDLL